MYSNNHNPAPDSEWKMWSIISTNITALVLLQRDSTCTEQYTTLHCTFHSSQCLCLRLSVQHPHPTSQWMNSFTADSSNGKWTIRNTDLLIFSIRAQCGWAVIHFTDHKVNLLVKLKSLHLSWIMQTTKTEFRLLYYVNQSKGIACMLCCMFLL